jgi:hypothetical protein
LLNELAGRRPERLLEIGLGPDRADANRHDRQPDLRQALVARQARLDPLPQQRGSLDECLGQACARQQIERVLLRELGEQ